MKAPVNNLRYINNVIFECQEADDRGVIIDSEVFICSLDCYSVNELLDEEVRGRLYPLSLEKYLTVVKGLTIEIKAFL